MEVMTDLCKHFKFNKEERQTITNLCNELRKTLEEMEKYDTESIQINEIYYNDEEIISFIDFLQEF